MKRIAIPLGCLAAVFCGCRTLRPRPISEIPMVDTSRQGRLLRGFYEIKEGSRWTSRVFAVSLDPPKTDRATYLELDCYVPPLLVEEFQAATLIAKVNGVEVGRQTFYQPGHATFTRYVPIQALKRKPAEVEFELDKSMTDPQTSRVTGVAAVSIGFKEYEQTAEYRETQMWLAREGFKKVEAERRLQIPPAKEQELMKLFLQLPVWQDLRFQNIKVAKNPLDLWMMQQILYEVQPDFVVETGTGQGGSALYWASALNSMGLERSRVLTVDTRNLAADASKHFLWKKYVEFVQGNSTDLETASRIAERVRGRKTVVTLDSDHAMEHVLQELRMYAPLVSRGSYLVVQATNLDGVPAQPGSGPGPYEAVRRFLVESGGKEFEKDLSREMMVLTFNPGGWLRRK
ncbi:MAG: CmcI family methyltransferase [Bryobacteraceae bacterium]|jgi:cephalosporin hydroxylase